MGKNLLLGAELALKAMGIKDQQQRTELLKRFQESQMVSQGMQQNALMQGQQRQQEYQGAISGLVNPFLQMREKLPDQDMMAPLSPEYAATIPQDYSDLSKRASMIAMQYAAPTEMDQLAKGLMGQQGEWKPQTMEEAISFEKSKHSQTIPPVTDLDKYNKDLETVFQQIKKEQEAISAENPDAFPVSDDLMRGQARIRLDEWRKSQKVTEAKPINMPPWYDSMAMEMMGSRYNTPEGQKEFADFIASPRGQGAASAYRTKYAQESATPYFSFPSTAEGIVPANARSGQVGASTGLNRPLTNEMITAIQQIQTINDAVKRLESTYKPDYVGAVSGRIGGLAEKTVGVKTEQAKFYSDLAQIKNSLIYLLSGKQINESEYNRLMDQLPTRELPSGVFEARMENFKLTVDSIIENRKKGMGGLGSQDLLKPTPNVPNKINTLPTDAKRVGSINGKPVYETPDGKRFVEE